MRALLAWMHSVSTPAAASRPRPHLELVWSAPSILGEFALKPEPTAPLIVDGVTLVYCKTYAEAKACIREMIADAAGKPVALDLETCPIPSERERLAALTAERKAVNAEAIAFRKAARRRVRRNPRSTRIPRRRTPSSKILDRQDRLCRRRRPRSAPVRDPACAGLWRRRARRGRRHRQGRPRGPRAAPGRLHGHPWRVLRSCLPWPPWRQSGKVHDSQQAARLALGKSKCSLAAAVKHYLKVDLDKEPQASDWAAPSLTEDQLRYAARDVIWLWRLCPPLFKDLGPQVSAYQIQTAAAPAIARMNTAGIAHRSRCGTPTPCARSPSKTQSRAPATATPASRSASRTWPRRSHGARREIAAFLKALLTEDELASGSDGKTSWELSTARPELRQAVHYPPIAPLIELSELDGLRLSFGEPLRFLVSPVTGRVHPHYQICGAPTGRSSTSEPNIQGAPRDPRIRGVFRAADGYVLVAADYQLHGAARRRATSSTIRSSPRCSSAAMIRIG